MDLDKFQRLCVIVSLLGFALAGIGIVAEVLGWWRDWGEVAVNLGTLVGVIIGLVAVGISATKAQVALVVTGVSASNVKLDELNTKVDASNLKHDEANAHLARVEDLLRDIRDRLPAAPR